LGKPKEINSLERSRYEWKDNNKLPSKKQGLRLWTDLCG
jgi:hypothetical protein